jgi:hypothetical protein
MIGFAERVVGIGYSANVAAACGLEKQVSKYLKHRFHRLRHRKQNF